jgi:hypothetical protein
VKDRRRRMKRKRNRRRRRRRRSYVYSNRPPKLALEYKPKGRKNTGRPESVYETNRGRHHMRNRLHGNGS